MELSRSDALRRVRWPAVLLCVCGVLELAHLLAFLVAGDRIVAVLARTLGERLGDWHAQDLEQMRAQFADLADSPLNLATIGLGVLAALVVVAGAWRMLGLRSWGLALAAAILVSIPCCGPCCGLFLPAGVWALVVLLQPDVQRAFAAERAPT
jgi:hypothetical protein